MYFKNLIDPSKRDSRLVRDKSFHNVVLILLSLIAFTTFLWGMKSLIGFNWFDYSKSVKVIIASSLAVLSVVIFSLTYLKHRGRVAQREFWGLMSIIFASWSYSLFGSIYNIYNNAPVLFLTILSITCALCLRSGIAILISILALTSFIAKPTSIYGFSDPALIKIIWALLLGLTLYSIYKQLRPGLVSIKGVLIMSLLTIMLPLQIIYATTHFQVIIVSVLLSTMYLFGKLYLSEGRSIVTRPMQSYSSGIVVLISLFLTVSAGFGGGISSIFGVGGFGDKSHKIISMISWYNDNGNLSASSFERGFDYVILVLLALAAIILKRRLKDCAVPTNWFVVNFPIWVTSSLLFIMLFEWDGVAWYILMVYALLLPISYLFGGINRTHLPDTLLGFTGLFLFLLIRYVDSGYGQVGIGIIFILISIALLFLRFLFKMKMEDSQTE